MKKFFALLLAMLMLASLTACGDQPVTDSSETQPSEPSSNTNIHNSSPEDLDDAGSSTDIESKVQKDVEDTITALTSEWEELAGVFTDYDSYVSNAGKVSAFYEKLNGESANLCVRMYVYALEYAEAIIASGKSTADLYDDMDELYDVIYDEAGEDIYDGIYDGILEEMYDALYDGVLKDQPDGVKYADWSGQHSNEYKQWSGTRSDVYEQWSDFRSDVYGFWTDTRSELYKDDLDSAKDEIGDFRKVVEKLQGENTEGSTTESTEAATDETQNEGSSANGIRSEFKEAMDSYEKFFDEYVAIMKKYKEDPSDMSILTDYATYMGQYAEIMKKFEAWENKDLNKAELQYYIDVQARITNKLLEAA